MVVGRKITSSRLFDYTRSLAQAPRDGGALSSNDELESVQISPDAENEASVDAMGSTGEQDTISKLSSRDREVIAHEAAHMAAAGSYVSGGASYTYQTGPDGKRYAIGGEVQVDVSPISGNPSATIAKMIAIRAAALAPADPSPQDIAVAAAASRMEAQARAQLRAVDLESMPGVKRSVETRYNRLPASTGTLINAKA
ncbi:MAG: putative metalloprotease CJM1_0395 family protein [Nibricoccus sp.]